MGAVGGLGALVALIPAIGAARAEATVDSVAALGAERRRSDGQFDAFCLVSTSDASRTPWDDSVEYGSAHVPRQLRLIDFDLSRWRSAIRDAPTILFLSH